MSNDLFGPLAISASGLSAQRKRMEAIAKNIANAETTRSEDGGVYRRRGVRITGSETSTVGQDRPASHRLPLARTSPTHFGARGLQRLEASSLPTVEAEEVVDESSGFTLVYDPNHPDADGEGYVRMPDVNAVTEMIDMMSATRAYEANLAAMRAYQSMVSRSLEI